MDIIVRRSIRSVREFGFAEESHGVYGMGIYIDEAQAKWFVDEWEKTGKKLNMGKLCVRFKKLDDVPLEVIGKAIKRMPVKQYIALYEKQLKANSAGKKVSKKRSTAKSKKR
jgi:uncharacterized protein (DUF1919 family)